MYKTNRKEDNDNITNSDIMSKAGNQRRFNRFKKWYIIGLTILIVYFLENILSLHSETIPEILLKINIINEISFYFCFSNKILAIFSLLCIAFIFFNRFIKSEEEHKELSTGVIIHFSMILVLEEMLIPFIA